MLLSVGGDQDTPANTKDFDYYHGVGRGGRVDYGSGDGGGGGGAAVIIVRVPGVTLPSKTVLFYTGDTSTLLGFCEA